MLKVSLEARGMTFLMEAQTAEIVGDDRVSGVRFADGKEVEADLVVMAVGIRPNIALAQQAGLHCERGIVVNDTMQTFDPKIYSVGECVQHRNQCYGLVAPLFEQAKVATAASLGRLGRKSVDLLLIHWPSGDVRLSRVLEAMNDRGKTLKGSKVLVLGVAYNPVCSNCWYCSGRRWKIILQYVCPNANSG